MIGCDMLRYLSNPKTGDPTGGAEQGMAGPGRAGPGGTRRVGAE